MHCLLPPICPISRKASSSTPTANYVTMDSACDTFEKLPGLQLPPMENTPFVLQTIANLLSQSNGYKDLFKNLAKALKTKGFEQIRKTNSNIFHYADYKVMATLSRYNSTEAEKLLTIKPLKLNCAPELIAHFSAGPDESILITKGNGDLIPYHQVKESLPSEKKKQFLKDIETLLSNDWHHPYTTRGTTEWYVDKNTKNIVLDEWSPLSPVKEPTAKREILDKTEQLLEL